MCCVGCGRMSKLSTFWGTTENLVTQKNNFSGEIVIETQHRYALLKVSGYTFLIRHSHSGILLSVILSKNSPVVDIFLFAHSELLNKWFIEEIRNSDEKNITHWTLTKVTITINFDFNLINFLRFHSSSMMNHPKCSNIAIWCFIHWIATMSTRSLASPNDSKIYDVTWLSTLPTLLPSVK